MGSEFCTLPFLFRKMVENLVENRRKSSEFYSFSFNFCSLSPKKRTDYMIFCFLKAGSVKGLMLHKEDIEMSGRIENMRLGNRVRKDAVFVLVTVLLVLILWLFISETVMSQTEGNITVDEEAFVELEDSYVGTVKTYLEEKGFRNSGVTLTRVVDESGKRSYEMVLHHKNMYKLSSEAQEVMLEEITTMAFHVSGCKFKVKLLS